MMNLSRAGRLAAALLALAFSSFAAAQTTTPETPLNRFLGHIDLGISASGEFTSNSSGTTSTTQKVTLKPSTTVGFLLTLRYTKSPFVGAEFNLDRVRYTQDFTFTNLVPGGSSTTVLGAQTDVTEYTFGYLVHTPHTYFGVQPFASVGAGSVAFRPTRGGGQGFTPQARAAYYYSVGAEQLVYGDHFGLRASFRQVFTNAPDFQATYLRDHQRQITSEPTIGFYVRF